MFWIRSEGGTIHPRSAEYLRGAQKPNSYQFVSLLFNCFF